MSAGLRKWHSASNTISVQPPESLMSALERDVWQSYLLNGFDAEEAALCESNPVRSSIRSTCWFCESKVKVNSTVRFSGFVTIQAVLLDVVVDPIALF